MRLSRVIGVTAAVVLGGAFATSAVPAITASASTTVQYQATVTIPAPPSANFSGAGGGGDGWAVALSSTQIFNVFHHQTYLAVNCHNQSNASTCTGYPKTITDGSNDAFATSVGPGMYFDAPTGHLYVWGTRESDHTAGVVCIDTTSTVADPFCGFSATSAVGDAPLDGGNNSGITNPVLVGTHWYAFNEVAGAASGSKNEMMCFDTTTDAACASQPYSIGSVPTLSAFSFVPLAGGVGSDVFVQLVGGAHELACFDTTTDASCAGSWPVSVSGYAGGAFALLDSSGNPTGVCDPISGDPCFNFSGASVATPTGMATVITTGGLNFLNGPGYVFGTKVFVPNATTDALGCYDYGTDASCANFPVTFQNLSLLYTVNPDPARPSCLWVNSDSGTDQIQNVDAYTGGPCADAPLRLLASSFVATPHVCIPSSWTSIQVESPSPSAYSSGSVSFENASGSPIYSPHTLDATGTAALGDLGSSTQTALPQFIFALTGISPMPAMTVKFVWSATDDPSCTVGSATATPASVSTPTTTVVPTSASTTTTTPAPLSVAPSHVHASYSLTGARNGSALVSWTPAINATGAPTTYTATASPGGATCRTTATSCTVRGLKAGITYHFTVAASFGTSATTSAQSNAAAPTVVPSSAPQVLEPTTVPVVLRCSRASCVGIADVTVARKVMSGGTQVGWKHLVLGRSSFHLQEGQRLTLRLAESILGHAVLPRQTAWWLARQSEFHMTLTVAILGDATTHTPIYLEAHAS